MTAASRRIASAVAPLQDTAYRRYFCGRVLSSAGSTASPVAAAFAALSIGGPSGLGWVLLAGAVPQVVLLMVGGVVADRLPRGRIMVLCNIMAGAAQAGAAILLLSGNARIWQLAVASSIVGMATAFFAPASQSIVSQLVDKDVLVQANAVLRLALNILKMAGPVLGGLAVATVGPGWAIAWDAATFFVSAAILSTVCLPVTRIAMSSFAADMREGWTDFWATRWLWILILQGTACMLFWQVGYQLLGPVYASRELGGAAPWGLVLAGFAAGLISGSAVALMWPPQRAGLVICLGAGALAVPLAAMAGGAPVAILIPSAFLAGVLLDVSMVAQTTLLQERVPDEKLSRANSFSMVGEMVLVPIGYVTAAPLLAAFGLAPVLAVCAAGVLVAAAVPVASRDIYGLVLKPTAATVDKPVTVAA